MAVSGVVAMVNRVWAWKQPRRWGTKAQREQFLFVCCKGPSFVILKKIICHQILLLFVFKNAF